MKDILLNNWHIMRIIRLVFSIFIIVEAISIKSGFLALFGSVFLVMALFNAGCSSGACASPSYNLKDLKKKEVEFEEIK